MNMQDKEFDDLFRVKLGDLEMEPSAQVWENIDTELNGKKRKSIFPVMSIAASVIILIAAGIIFIPKRENVKLDHEKNNLAINHPKQSIVKPIGHEPVNTIIKKEIQPEKAIAINSVAIVQHHSKKAEIVVAKPTEQPAPAIEKPAPVKAEQPQLIAAVTSKQQDITSPVVPDNTTPLTVKQPAINDLSEPEPKVALASVQPTSTKQDRPVVKRHGIRNFGDLVNIVVAKVDKRKDKVIEFTDTDDDESTLTAVNVGPVKIKKDK